MLRYLIVNYRLRGREGGGGGRRGGEGRGGREGGREGGRGREEEGTIKEMKQTTREYHSQRNSSKTDSPS